MGTRPPLLPLFLLFLAVVGSIAAPQTEESITLVGTAECRDCAEKNIESELAFKGLHLVVKCKNSQGGYKTKGVGRLDKDGNFNVPLPRNLVRGDRELEDKCTVELQTVKRTPCSAHENRLSPSKIIFKSKENGKHEFSIAGKVPFFSTTCPSEFFWPDHKFPPVYKKPLPPFPKFPPIYKKPLPPLPKFPPIYKKVLPPLTKSPPIYKKSLPPLPKFPPIYVKPLPPLPKFPPIYVKPLPPLPQFPPIYKKPLPPLPEFPPIYKKPLPPLPKFPPIYVKPLPQLPQFPPLYKKPLPHLPEFPPIYKKPLPPLPEFPPFYKKSYPHIPPYPKFGWPPLPPKASHQP